MNYHFPRVSQLSVVAAVLCAVVSGAPQRTTLAPAWTVKSQLPYWHKPCGSNNLDDFDLEDLRGPEDEAKAVLGNLKVQLTLTLNDYLTRDYEYLYEKVRNGVHKHQYIPNWIPDHDDVRDVKGLRHAKTQLIINHLPKLHSDLQKFAVALEEMVEDETYSLKVQNALLTTQAYLKMMICEVESSIMSLTAKIPDRIERGIMVKIERDPEDDTRRLIRDWGILLKYKDYLHAWKHVFDP